MRLVRYLSAVSLAAVLACGDDGGSPAPPPADPPAPGEGPGGGTDPGDGGNPGGGDPGGGDPGGADGGGGDPSVIVVSSSSDPECSGLLPSRVPSAVSVDAGPVAACLAGVSEGGGHVAVGVRFIQGGTGTGATEWQAFSPDGTREQRFVLHGAGGPRLPLFPQEDGWQGVRALGSTSFAADELVLVALSGDGSTRGEERASAPQTRSWRVSPDPLGGALIVATGVRSGTCFGEAFRFDAGGALRGRSEQVGCFVSAAGVSSRGDALVLEADVVGGERIIHWIAPGGAQARSPAPDPARRGADHLEPLLDGSLAGRSGDAWVVRYPHLADRSEPAPDWLASRPGWLFRFTRGNRGYALFPPGEALVSCAQTIEIRAPSGRLCGTIAFREEGGSCTTRTIDQGWDGTVVQQSARDSCRYRWWPRLLAGD